MASHRLVGLPIADPVRGRLVDGLITNALPALAASPVLTVRR